ncbi:MAG: methionyl-tRNA formyltransferase [Calditrichaeota bacterium]|nr:MAG: methionyl-tRNA formyltransferase [Calditrichota bacterium]
MGTPEFAVPSLEKIHNSRHQIVGVVTQPDRPRGRGLKLLPPPVKEAAIGLNLNPILQPESLKDPEFLTILDALQADVFVVVAFRILPEAVFTMPPRGTINLHPSLLPKFRGAAPIHWTIIQGEKTTGVTTIFIQKKIDAGNIILQEEYPVHPDETAGELHDRLAIAGAELLLKTLDLIEAGDVHPIVQDEKMATPAPKITREMCHLSFTQPAVKVKQWIHGLSPYPGAFAYDEQNRIIKLYRAAVISEEPDESPPGTILKAKSNDLWISCSPGVIAIEEIQLQGKKRLNVMEFLKGNHLKEGDRLR